MVSIWDLEIINHEEKDGWNYRRVRKSVGILGDLGVGGVGGVHSGGTNLFEAEEGGGVTSDMEEEEGSSNGDVEEVRIELKWK